MTLFTKIAYILKMALISIKLCFHQMHVYYRVLNLWTVWTAPMFTFQNSEVSIWIPQFMEHSILKKKKQTLNLH